MLTPRQRWIQTSFSELTAKGLEEIESLEAQKVIQSIALATDSRANPVEAIPQLDFLRHTATAHGLKIYSLRIRNDNDIYMAHYDDADAYQGLKDFNYLAVWSAPSEKTHVILMKDCAETLAAFSSLASRLAAIELEPTNNP